MIRSRGAVAFQHGITAPAHQPLKVPFLTACQQEIVSVGVPEAVRVNCGGAEAGHIGAYLQPFAYPVGSESPSLA